MMNMMHNNDWLWIVLIIIVLLIAFGSLFMMLRITQDNRRISSERKQALDILKERYAKGEISDEEFEHQRKKLEEYTPPQ
ncbi:MAG TPA: SHOCT domain-containing protein [Virgibacillus sp.]|nr:SHOCT domain-containing protein [Virgibacillus sp.]